MSVFITLNRIPRASNAPCSLGVGTQLDPTSGRRNRNLLSWLCSWAVSKAAVLVLSGDH